MFLRQPERLKLKRLAITPDYDIFRFYFVTFCCYNLFFGLFSGTLRSLNSVHIEP